MKRRNFFAALAALPMAKFLKPTQPPANPLQDAQADILAIESGLTSRAKVIAESGHDFDEIIKDQHGFDVAWVRKK